MLTTEIINDFITEYSRSRVIIPTTVKAVLKMAQDSEKKYGKDFTEFSKEEVLKMYSEVGAISINSLMNKNLILSHAYNFHIFQRCANVAKGGVYGEITKDDLRTCIDVNKKKSTIFSKQQIDNIIDDVLNYVDKAIIALLFEGVGVEQWRTDLMYLEPKQLSRSDGFIYFNDGKKVKMNDELYTIVRTAMEEETLLSYTPGSDKVSSVRGLSIYKTRFNALYGNTNSKDIEDAERRYRYLQRRIMIMKDYLGFEKFTASSIVDSGLLHYLHEGMNETNTSLREYLKTSEAKQLCWNYGIKSELYQQIVLSKFEG